MKPIFTFFLLLFFLCVSVPLGNAQEIMKMKDSVPTWLLPMKVSLYSFPTEEEWNLLQEIRFPFILELNLNSNYPDLEVDNQKTINLSELPTLRAVHFMGDMISDDLLKTVRDLPALEYVSLKHCDNITDIGISHLSKVKNLKRLRFASCRKVTSSAIGAFRLHPTLASLEIELCVPFTSTLFSDIASIPQLIHFYYDNAISEFSEEELLKLADMKKLKSLGLSPCDQLTRPMLETIIQKLPDLECVFLQNCSKMTESDEREIQEIFPNLMIVINTGYEKFDY
ncbi:MAG: hypothetical protein Q4C70_13200 [Planctomycetia bacterium]|nr:hypothetical protein [Planctomycetia bacterium]